MKITASRTSLGEINEDVLIVPVFEGETPVDAKNSPALASLDHLTRGLLESVFESGEISGKRDRSIILHNAGNLSTKRLLLYGAGKRENLSPLIAQRLAGASIRALRLRGVRSAAFLLRESLASELNVRAIVEGAILGQVQGDIYRSKDEPASEIETLHLISESPVAPDIEQAINTGTCMAEAANFARTLGFEPGNMNDPDRDCAQSRRDGRARRAGL